MKSITNFINESLRKLNLDGIHYSITPHKWNRDSAIRKSTAKKQEAEVIDTISELYPNIKVMSSTDYAESKGETWSPEYDLKNGDIVIEDGDTLLFIDVKIASDKIDGSGKTSLGPISLSSVLEFANKENHIYLCMNCDGSRVLAIDGKKLYDEFTKDPILFASRGRKRTADIDLDIKINYPTDIEDDGKVYLEDYISTAWLVSHYKAIKYTK
jgi:hypothetical protein